MSLFNKEKLNSLMGINRRNLQYVYSLNERKHFPLVDDKVKTKEILNNFGLPVPETYIVVSERKMITKALILLDTLETFTIKPARGFGGSGIFVVKRDDQGGLINSKGRNISLKDIAFHMTSIMSGLYSLSQVADSILVEHLIIDSSAFKEIHGTNGVSDIRIIVCESKPVMAMLRLPGSSSGGVANLHSGGIGVGIDIETGITNFAISKRKPIELHPDTKVSLQKKKIPHWQYIIEVSKKINNIFKMGYLGVDFVVDNKKGPMILEVNARPGLDIQLANQMGLRKALIKNKPND